MVLSLESRLSKSPLQGGEKEEERVMIAFGAGSGGWRAMACEALGGANLFPTFANLFVTQPISCTHCPTCCHKHLQSTQSSRSYFLDAQASLAPTPLSRLARFSLCRRLLSVTERPQGIPVVPGGQIFSESYDQQIELGLDGSPGGMGYTVGIGVAIAQVG